MTDTDLIDRALRERAARWAATEPAPPPLRAMLDEVLDGTAPARRGRVRPRRVWLAAGAGVLVVAAVVVLVAALRPSAGHAPAAVVTPSWTPDNPGGLTAAEYVRALRIAHQDADRYRGKAATVNGWPTTVTSVTALALPRAATSAYTGGVVDTRLPARVLVIRLVGSFPGGLVAPPPCAGSPNPCAHLRVNALTALVDPHTGKSPVGSADASGRQGPLPDATVLFRR